MIPNLKEKLAQLSAEQTAEPAPDTGLDLECSEYTTTYDADFMMGDISIEDTFGIDYDVLSAICMEGFDNEFGIEDIVYFDTETTGLGSGVSTVAFLVGVGYYEGGRFICRQFLMNDYHQETSMLDALNNILVKKKAVISFNGKAFDRHIVNSRSIMNRLIRPLEDMIHLDIMHSARRLYSRRIGSCSMKNLEEKIIGIYREGDISGALIPEVFADYIKYKDDTMLRQVIEHNKMDIVNMTAISYMLYNAYAHPDELEESTDIFCQGRIYRKLGLVDRAKMCYNTLGMDKDAIHELALIAKSERDYSQSIVLYSKLTTIDRLTISYNVELAKIYEHKTCELEKALDEVNKAMVTSLTLKEIGRVACDDNLEKRKTRILNKLSSKRKDNI